LRELLHYDPETGIFIRRKTAGPSRSGQVAGGHSAGGYPVIMIDRRNYMAHRLAWLYVHGRHPTGVVDHINGDRADNRIANLRECSRLENARNQRGRASSGLKGAYFGRRWQSRIQVNGRTYYLGCFPTAEEAAKAYDEAARRLHGEFARTNDNAPASRAPKSGEGDD
jgi:hypothetical protein